MEDMLNFRFEICSPQKLEGFLEVYVVEVIWIAFHVTEIKSSRLKTISLNNGSK